MCCFSLKSVEVETMAWKYVLLGLAVSIPAIAYWLYTPLPDGYSSQCTRSLQAMLAPVKAINVVVGVVSVSVLA